MELMHYAQVTLKGIMFLPKSLEEQSAISRYRAVRESIGGTVLVFTVSIVTFIAGVVVTGGALVAENTELLPFVGGIAMMLLGATLLCFVSVLSFAKRGFIRTMREESRMIDLRNDYFGIGLRRAIFFGDFALEDFDHQREVLSGVLANKLMRIVENDVVYDRLHMLGTLETDEACAKLALSLQYVVADIQRSVASRMQPYLEDERISREALAELHELNRLQELERVRQETRASSVNLQRVHNG